jgi:WD40 repeat protein
VAYSPDGRTLASAHDDQTVKLWDVETGLNPLVLRGHMSAVESVAFSPDGRTLVSGGSDYTVKLWDVATGHEIRALHGHTESVKAVAFSSDGRSLASGGGDRVVRLWDVATGRQVHALHGHTHWVHDVAFSPDGRTVASAGADNLVKLWDAATGREVRTLRGHTQLLWAVAFSPDGRWLASAAADKTVKLWEVATGHEVLSLSAHAAAVQAVTFSPDGRRIASAGEDGGVMLLDATTGQAVLALRGNMGSIQSVAFSPDGQTLAAAGQDGSIKLWDSTPLTPELRKSREAQSLVEYLSGRRPTLAEVAAAIRGDLTIDDDVRRRALALVESRRRILAVREVEGKVKSLFDRLLFREDVLASLRADPAVSEPERARALGVAEHYPENAIRLTQASRGVVFRPDAGRAAYLLALRQSEAAHRILPDDGVHLGTLGVAQFRVGQYRAAAATLARAHQLNAQTFMGYNPTDLAFLALAQHRLGETEKARATLRRLRETMKRPSITSQMMSEQGSAAIREADAIELDLVFPADPFAP